MNEYVLKERQLKLLLEKAFDAGYDRANYEDGSSSEKPDFNKWVETKEIKELLEFLKQ